MTFLNATLLLGGLAAAIPIALHLLGRKEPRRIRFPATRFLQQRLQTQRRSLRVKRWALLALRAALLAIVALALAQPQIHRETLGQWLGIGSAGLIGLLVGGIALWSVLSDRAAGLRWALSLIALALLLGAGGMAIAVAAGGPRPVQTQTAPAAVALLIDNSPTAAYRNPDGSTRLERAAETATWVLGRYPAASRLALVDRSARPAAFALDAATIQKRLQALRPQEVTRPLSQRIEAALRLLRTSDLPRKTLFIFSDLAAASWDQADEAEAARLAAVVNQEPEVTIHVVDIGSATYRNRVLTLPELVDVTPAPEVPSTITITARTDRKNGDEEMTVASEPANAQLAVELRLYENEPGLPALRDDAVQLPELRTRDRQSLTLNATGEGTAVLTLPPLGLGVHHGVIELASDDALPLDNRRYFTVRVRPPREILIVADNPDERRVLATMLNAFEAPDPRREYEIEFATTTSLAEVSLEPFAAVGLFDPSLPPTLVRDQLDVWVRNGGQLFLALGPALAPDFLNEPGAAAVAGRRPQIEWPLVGNPQRIWRKPEPGTFMQVMRPGHPVLSELSKAEGAPWSAFRIRYYWQLADADSFSELTRYAGTEHLALGQRGLGEGRVMVMTTPLPALLPPADRWNDLGVLGLSEAWPVYLILLQQIFEDLSGGTRQALNVLTGEPLALPVEPESAQRWQLFAPAEAPVPLDRSEAALVPGIPQRAGNYWLRGAGGETLGFSANLPPEATELQRGDPQQLDALLGKENYQLSQSREEIQLAEGASSDGRPLYATVMLVVMALFLLEQLLANRFYPSGGETTAAPRSRAAAA